MELSIVIVSFNTKDLLVDCVESIFANTRNLKFEVVVIDNASSDASVEAIQKLKIENFKLKIIRNRMNLGFAEANNQGLKKAKGEFVLFLNSDTVIKDNLLKEMVSWMKNNPGVGISTCALKNRDGSLQGTGGYFPTLIRVFSWMTIQDIPFVDFLIKPFHPLKAKSFFKSESFYKKKRELDWVTGAFFLTRKEIFGGVEQWDKNYFMYFEEVDLCFRAKRLGWRVMYLPQWSILHYGGASGTSEFSTLSEFRGIKRFYKKFYPRWQYPLLRLFLKIGSLARIVALVILEGRESAKIYVKAYKQA